MRFFKWFQKKSSIPQEPDYGERERQGTILSLELEPDGHITSHFYLPDFDSQEHAHETASHTATMLFLLSTGKLNHILQEAVITGGQMSGNEGVSRAILSLFNNVVKEWDKSRNQCVVPPIMAFAKDGAN